MGTLYLVRHGQASFGADDYDRLSDLGRRQAIRLGEWLRERAAGGAPEFSAVLTGTLRRQLGTWQAIAEGGAFTAPHVSWPGLNEYDSHAVIGAIHGEPLGRADTPEAYRAHFRLLRQGLAAWMRGDSAPVGMPRYADFRAGVVAALDHVRRQWPHGDVLLVSSGGPIATALTHVLETPPEVSIELNLRIRNTAVSELQVSPKRLQLGTFNTLAHLDGAAYRDWVTYT